MKGSLTLLLAFSFCLTTGAQSIEDRLTQRRVSCYEVFFNMAGVVPPLYETRSFDSIGKALDVVLRYCDSNNAIMFYLQTLLSIQQSRFLVSQLPQDGRWDDWLQAYALQLRASSAGSYAARRYSFYWNNTETKLYQFIRRWANDLLADRKFTSNEAFLCRVLAGDIQHPQAVLKTNQTKYPELYALLRKNYSAERKHPDANLAFLSGVWLPSGNAKLLGVHPSVGFQVGGRSRYNEFDLTFDFRFVNAANHYNILRRDSVYAIHHFFGGYIGLDYTRYLIHTTSFEAGVTGGIGYDGFDVTDATDDDDDKDYLKPYSINSLNLNAGLRVNYYFNPHFYIGIGGRFNKIRYSNKGGTNLHGNTVSLDFYIGG